MTAAQYRAEVTRVPSPGRRKHKFGAKAIVIDGRHFPSLLEGRRYRNLKLLLRAGRIRDLKLQQRFDLTTDGAKVGVYVCDFAYEELQAGRWVPVVEDAKGVVTQLYTLKRKLFQQLYPHVDFREIRK